MKDVDAWPVPQDLDGNTSPISDTIETYRIPRKSGCWKSMKGKDRPVLQYHLMIREYETSRAAIHTFVRGRKLVSLSCNRYIYSNE